VVSIRGLSFFEEKTLASNRKRFFVAHHFFNEEAVARKGLCPPYITIAAI
jgi:hypothetical protein